MSSKSEKDLNVFLHNLNPVLQEGVFVYYTGVPDEITAHNLHPVMQFREGEGLSMILPKSQAERASLDYSYPCRMITLTVYSDLHAVGMIAEITGLLSRNGISVNMVSGFYHDHLFIPEDRVMDVLNLL